jgi:hypothetical protein
MPSARELPLDMHIDTEIQYTLRTHRARIEEALRQSMVRQIKNVVPGQRTLALTALGRDAIRWPAKVEARSCVCIAEAIVNVAPGRR